MKKAFKNRSLKAFVLSLGRCERIRTFDPLHPMQVRYQAAPHTEAVNYNALQIARRGSGGEQVSNFSEFATHQFKPLA
jgi:hypothetical protein